MSIQAYTSQVGDIALEKGYEHYDLALAESNVVRCPDPAKASQMETLIAQGKAEGDTVGGVVSGWQIALKAMKPGSVWEVYLPHYMGYGERGSGQNIPPYSTLVFKIELLEVR